MARIGYGYKRTESEFGKANCDQVFIDTPRSGRDQRAVAFKVALRAGQGDVLVLLAPSDLGHGKELTRLRTTLADMGVKIEHVEKPAPAKRRPGRKGFSPDTEADAAIREAWHDPHRTVAGVIAIAAQHGHTVALHQLKHRYKARFPEMLEGASDGT